MPVHRVPIDDDLSARLRRIMLLEKVAETHIEGDEMLVVTTGDSDNTETRS